MPAPATIPVAVEISLPYMLAMANKLTTLWVRATPEARERVWVMAGGKVTGARLLLRMDWVKILHESTQPAMTDTIKEHAI